jgi:hypothetical protein
LYWSLDAYYVEMSRPHINGGRIYTQSWFFSSSVSREYQLFQSRRTEVPPSESEHCRCSYWTRYSILVLLA